WSVAQGHRVCELPEVGDQMSFSPDGHFLATNNRGDDTVLVWELASAQLVREFKGHRGGISGLVFDPACRVLISGGLDNVAIVWRVGLQPGDGRLTKEELTRAWEGLAMPNGKASEHYLEQLAGAPESALSFLDKQVQAIPQVPEAQVKAWMRELDDADFRKRERAQEDLHRVRGQAEPLLRQAMKEKTPPEAKRRIRELLEEIDKESVLVASPETLRVVRVVRLLEALGDPRADKLLTRLAGGAPNAAETRAAKDALAKREKATESRP